MLGPESVCGRVFGLVDVEYGWPHMVNIDSSFSAGDLVPGIRRHPVLVRQGRTVAVAVSRGEYDAIMKLLQPTESQGLPNGTEEGRT